MGGKTLRFPKRKKFVPEGPKIETEEKAETDEEKAEKERILREAGIIK